MFDIESKIDRAQLYPELVEVLVQTYKQGEKILDVGCAGGHFYLTLSRAIQSLDYTGVDITPAYIDFAREKFPGVPFSVGDVRKLPFPDKSFDTVLCLFVLIHLDEEGVREAVRELTRVAKHQVIFAGYFATKRVYGGQTTDGNDFIYDVVNVEELRTEGWALEISEEDGPPRLMKVGADLQGVDGGVYGFEYNLPVKSYARLVKE
ncbi:MAG: methyltransferase domain-containing protein [Candidatus Paceibacterota bacterium]|jgi:SAM-dependent methyltransferase